MEAGIAIFLLAAPAPMTGTISLAGAFFCIPSSANARMYRFRRLCSFISFPSFFEYWMQHLSILFI
jgi:hypothetical protein